jgi:hypothetical protein
MGVIHLQGSICNTVRAGSRGEKRMTAARPPAGWYPDPGGSGSLRYWDGSSWTHHLFEADDGDTRASFVSEKPSGSVIEDPTAGGSLPQGSPANSRRKGLSRPMAAVVGAGAIVGVAALILVQVLPASQGLDPKEWCPKVSALIKIREEQIMARRYADLSRYTISNYQRDVVEPEAEAARQENQVKDDFFTDPGIYELQMGIVRELRRKAQAAREDTEQARDKLPGYEQKANALLLREFGLYGEVAKEAPGRVAEPIARITSTAKQIRTEAEADKRSADSMRTEEIVDRRTERAQRKKRVLKEEGRKINGYSKNYCRTKLPPAGFFALGDPRSLYDLEE